MKWETFKPNEEEGNVGGSWIAMVQDRAASEELWGRLRESSWVTRILRSKEKTSKGYVFMADVLADKESLLQDQAPVRSCLSRLRRLGVQTTVFFKSKETGTNVYYSPAGTDRVYRTTKHPVQKKPSKNKKKSRRGGPTVMAPPPPSKVLGRRIMGSVMLEEVAGRAAEEDDEEEPVCLRAGQTLNFVTPPAHRVMNPNVVRENQDDDDDDEDFHPRRCDKLIVVGDEQVTVAEATTARKDTISVEEFYERFVKKTPDQCEAEERSPQRSDEWKQARKYAVTTSQFGAAAGLSPYSTPDDVILSKLWETFSGNEATRWGTMCESKAEEAYRRWCKDDLRRMYSSFGKQAAERVAESLVLEERGLIKFPATPWMGASPDGIAVWTDPEGVKRRRLVEYKCPFFLWKDSGRHPYAKFEGKDKDGLPLPPQYRAQIQGVMGMFMDEDERIRGEREGERGNRNEAWGITQCDFVVWQPRRCWVSRVDMDSLGWRRGLYPSLQSWFMERYLPAATNHFNGKLADGQGKPVAKRRVLRLNI